jgi:hypothetical protein
MTDDPASDEESRPNETTDPELRRLLGTFDTPAFARRGSDLERCLATFNQRVQAARIDLLPMVGLRLRQWLAVASGPLDFADCFAARLDPLYAAAGSPMHPWASAPGSLRARRCVAADLEASVRRFNLRWRNHVAKLDLDPLNRMIELYNSYYVLEKECVLGTHRLAARFFQPRDPLSSQRLLALWPPLPLPDRSAGR